MKDEKVNMLEEVPSADTTSVESIFEATAVPEKTKKTSKAKKSTKNRPNQNLGRGGIILFS